MAGHVADLASLNLNRYDHACGSYKNEENKLVRRKVLTLAINEPF